MRYFSLVTIAALATMFAAVSPSRAQPGAGPSAAGLWEQVDEKSGKPESWFRITEKGGVYEGVLVQGISQAR